MNNHKTRAMGKSRWGLLSGLLVCSCVLLAACGPSPKEVVQSEDFAAAQSRDQEQSSSEPALDEERIRRIVDEVQDVINRADESLDASILSERLTEGALDLRTAQINRAKKTDYELPPLNIEVNVASATVAKAWPRVLLVGSSAATDDPAEVYMFTQAGPEEQYMLENWVRAVGGNSIRGVAVEEGSKALDPSAEGFRFTPEDTMNEYIEFLNNPDDEASQAFEDKTLSVRFREDLKKLNDAVSKAGKVTARALPPEYPVVSVQLANGDALVAGNFDYVTTFERTVAGSTMTIGGTVGEMLDNPEVIGNVSVRYTVDIFFIVPSSEQPEEPVRVVGAERAFKFSNRHDDAIPEGE